MTPEAIALLVVAAFAGGMLVYHLVLTGKIHDPS